MGYIRESVSETVETGFAVGHWSNKFGIHHSYGLGPSFAMAVEPCGRVRLSRCRWQHKVCY